MTSMRVAMIGYGFMGAAHSQGWRVAPRFFDLPAFPEMTLLVGRNAGCASRPPPRSGAGPRPPPTGARPIARDDIDVIDIVTPGDSHAEIAIAALEAGKHVLCEKPLANTVAEAEAMAAAAEKAAGEGRLRDARPHLPPRARDDLRPRPRRRRQDRRPCSRCARATCRTGWSIRPTPLVWRLQKELRRLRMRSATSAPTSSTSSQYITGMRLTSVSGTSRRSSSERPVLESTSGLGGTGGSELGDVTVDDVALFTGRYDSGVLGIFEATRFATGRKNALRVEVSGSKGAIAFDLEDLNSLRVLRRDGRAARAGLHQDPGDRARASVRLGLVADRPHARLRARLRAPGEGLRRGDRRRHASRRPSFADGVQVQRVLAAVEASSGANSAWTDV